MTKSKQQINREKQLLEVIVTLHTSLLEERLRQLVAPVHFREVLKAVYTWAKELEVTSQLQ